MGRKAFHRLVPAFLDPLTKSLQTPNASNHGSFPEGATCPKSSCLKTLLPLTTYPNKSSTPPPTPALSYQTLVAFSFLLICIYLIIFISFHSLRQAPYVILFHIFPGPISASCMKGIQYTIDEPVKMSLSFRSDQ